MEKAEAIHDGSSHPPSRERGKGKKTKKVLHNTSLGQARVSLSTLDACNGEGTQTTAHHALQTPGMNGHSWGEAEREGDVQSAPLTTTTGQWQFKYYARPSKDQGEKEDDADDEEEDEDEDEDDEEGEEKDRNKKDEHGNGGRNGG